jgi:hypothetical protein
VSPKGWFAGLAAGSGRCRGCRCLLRPLLLPPLLLPPLLVVVRTCMPGTSPHWAHTHLHANMHACCLTAPAPVLHSPPGAGMPVTSVRELRVLQTCKHPNLVELKRVVTGGWWEAGKGRGC